VATSLKVNVEVDVTKFDALYESFKKYKDEVDATPEVWKKLGAASESTKANFQQSLGSLVMMAEDLNAVLSKAKTLDNVTASTSRHWRDLARSTFAVAGNIKDTTASLLRWAGVTSLVGGLLGGGTLFGIDKLGDSVAYRRTQALGTGTSYGSAASFRVNMERLGDPEGVLERVNEATHDVNKQVALRGLGLSKGDMQGDTANVAEKAVLGLKKLVDRTPEALLANTLQAYHADQIFDLNYAQRLKRMSPEEVSGIVKKSHDERGQFGLDEATQRRWQEFSTQMSTAGKEIETVLVKGLVALEPGLLAMSRAFARTAESLLAQDGPVSHWLGELNVGLEELAKRIDTKEFRDGLSHFVASVETMAKDLLALGQGVAKTAHWLVMLFGVGSASAAEAPGRAGVGTGGAGGAGGAGPSRGLFGHPSGRGGARGGTDSSSPPLSSKEQHAAAMELMDELVKKRGWTEDSAAIAAGNARVESAFKFSAAGDPQVPGGSHDLMQWNRGRWADFHSYSAAHPELSGMALRAAFIDHEARGGGKGGSVPGMWSQKDLSNAGAISHAYEGYATQTTGARVGAARQYLDEYKSRSTKITISKNPGANPAAVVNAVAAQ
jgi:hypothetical protein